MTTPIRFALCALVVAAAWMPLRTVRAADPRVTTGRVLVLDNERTLEGDIARDGDEYRVRRPLGETSVPADKVLCLCASREEAYAFLCTRANLRDPDERLRLARWCLLYGLRAQALAEANAAVDLRPKSAEALQLLHSLQRSAATASSTAAPSPENETATRKGAADEVEPPVSLLPPADFSAEALILFATRVQPILMNTCVSCHASSRGGAFRLIRAFEGGTVNHRATQQNLVAVLAQLNREHPAASPLLLKAVSVHGEATQAPLKNRQTPAYRTLEEWVRLAVPNNSQLPEQPVVLAAPEPKTESPQPAPVLQTGPPGEVISAPPATAIRSAGPPPAASPPTATPQPAADAAPLDAFDPVIFNRQVHPKQ
jgi:hypothetical protein